MAKIYKVKINIYVDALDDTDPEEIAQRLNDGGCQLIEDSYNFHFEDSNIVHGAVEQIEEAKPQELADLGLIKDTDSGKE
jgi:hypothetical protein